MGKRALTKKEVEELVRLRKIGHSFPEIHKITGRSSSTVFRYVGEVDPLPEYAAELKRKQGGSFERAKRRWSEAKSQAESMVGAISERDLLMLIVGLYWGEGTKKRCFSFINGDPDMIRVFVRVLSSLGVPKGRITLGLRLFSGTSAKEAYRFWSEIAGVTESDIKYVEWVAGNGTDKLPFGMCRVGVSRGERYFKLIMNMIAFIKQTLANPLP